MANSNITLGSVVGYAKSFPEIAPIIQTTAGGLANQPALTIANDVMTEMVAQVFNWKWNRFKLPLFNVNGWQQDYALNVINLGWLEHGFLLDVNNTALPKPIWPLEVDKDLEQTSTQYGMPGMAAWLPNDQLIYGTWGGAANAGDTTLGNNPQPNQTITNPIGVSAQPNNPILQVQDAFGNLWVLTGYGKTGSSTPFASNLNPVFPTPQNPNQVATTASDGTCTWTAINPKGQGIRCAPIPPQLGVVYQFNLIGQYRPFAFLNGGFTSFNQTLEPLPDDFAKYFRQGFVAMCYAHSSEVKVRAKFSDMYNIWQNDLQKAKAAGAREREENGFYPSTSLVQQPFAVYPGPAWPFQIPY